MKQEIAKRFEESSQTVARAGEMLAAQVAQAVAMIVDSYKAGGGVFLFGNGGSAADAQHIAGELVGRFLKERRALKAQALTTDSSILTCLANDYSYDIIFARQLAAGAKRGDIAWALSTSGNSACVLNGLREARRIGMRTLLLTGKDGGACRAEADLAIIVPSQSTPRIQETHMVIYHTICEFVEAALAD